MAQLLRMPEVAANTEEAVLGSWAIPEGSSFSAGTVLATVETAKAAVDVEAEAPGVLVRTLVAAGTEVPVGSAIALLADPGEQVADADAELATLTGVAAALPAAVAAPPGPTQSVRLFVSPLARRLARDAGITLEQLHGTGPHDRIVRRDVEAAIAAGRHASPDSERTPAGPHDAGFVDVPHTRLRAATAATLTASKRDAPHFYLRASADVADLMRLRTQLNESPGARVSVNDLVVKAVALAHTRVPDMNVIWTESAVRRFTSVDLSVAVATERGLLTPVVRGVETLRIGDLAAITAELSERARTGALRQHELTGGSATVTNLGMYGTEDFAAIINPPQSAILAVGAARQTPVVRDGVLSVSTTMTLTVSVDHRPVDGVVAARWLRELVGLLERPGQLLR